MSHQPPPRQRRPYPGGAGGSSAYNPPGPGGSGGRNYIDPYGPIAAQAAGLPIGAPEEDRYAPPRRRKRRVFPWAFLAIQALFVIWVIAGVASGQSAAAGCHDRYLTHAQCASASDAGTAIGVGLVVALWVAVDVILGVSYGIWRLARR